MSFIKTLLSGSTGKLVESVGNVIDNMTTTKEEKIRLDIELKKAEMQYQQDMRKFDIEETKTIMADKSDARDMAVQVQTSRYATLLNKNISPILAIGATILTFLMFILIIFCSSKMGPNKDIFLYILGVLSAIVTQVFSFYFGSSQGSADKNSILHSMQRNKQ